MGMIMLLVIEAPKVYFSMHARASTTILHAGISVRARPMIVSQITRSRPTLLDGGGDIVASLSSASLASVAGHVFCFLDFPRFVFADFAFVLSPSFLSLGFFLAGWVVEVTCFSVGVVVGM